MAGGLHDLPGPVSGELESGLIEKGGVGGVVDEGRVLELEGGDQGVGVRVLAASTVVRGFGGSVLKFNGLAFFRLQGGVDGFWRFGRRTRRAMFG